MEKLEHLPSPSIFCNHSFYISLTAMICVRLAPAQAKLAVLGALRDLAREFAEQRRAERAYQVCAEVLRYSMSLDIYQRSLSLALTIHFADIYTVGQQTLFETAMQSSSRAKLSFCAHRAWGNIGSPLLPLGRRQFDLQTMSRMQLVRVMKLC
eukprot:2805399-Pleurochrysis_carterae.AAC.3